MWSIFRILSNSLNFFVRRNITQLKLLSSLVLFLMTGVVYAKPPFIDYQWKFSPDACFIRANDAMVTAGFKTKATTEEPDGVNEVVGVKDDYKGVVACVGEGSEIAIFIVSGPNYEQARKLALKLKANF